MYPQDAAVDVLNGRYFMNIVNSGDSFNVYTDAIKTYTKLPAGTYKIMFSKMTGFYLALCEDMAAGCDKVYGNTLDRVTKTINGFKKSDRNFGVIVSGFQGTGKSLFARLLANEFVNNDLPVILANEYVPGIADFIASIDQEAMVLFDEFDKKFYIDNSTAPQDELLSLIDGVYSGKKLFVVTCNELYRVNKYFVNRPGRFHYHFVFGNITQDEAKEYLTDNLSKDNLEYIDGIIRFSMMANLTYDMLRAIVFEINNGYTLSEALEDINIQKTEEDYDIMLSLDNGYRYNCFSYTMDLFSKKCAAVYMDATSTQYPDICVKIYPDGIKFEQSGKIFVDPTCVILDEIYTDDGEYDNNIREYIKESFDSNNISVELVRRNGFEINRYVV